MLLFKKKNRSETDYSTVFYFNTVGSVLVYGFLFLCAPSIANFFDEPQLKLITRVVGLNLIINSLGIVQQARLTIDLNFKRQAQASLIAVVISGGIGLWMAYNGWGVWTLVWQGLLNNLFRVLFFMDFFSLVALRIIFFSIFSHSVFFWGKADVVQYVAYGLYQLLFTYYWKSFFRFRARLF